MDRIGRVLDLARACWSSAVLVVTDHRPRDVSCRRCRCGAAAPACSASRSICYSAANLLRRVLAAERVLRIAPALLLAFILACGSDLPSDPTRIEAAQTLPTVTRVIDGDTVVVEGVGTVRLIGVDTPETVDPRRPVQYFGREASDFTKQLATGKRVRLEFDQDRTDRYVEHWPTSIFSLRTRLMAGIIGLRCRDGTSRAGTPARSWGAITTANDPGKHVGDVNPLGVTHSAAVDVTPVGIYAQDDIGSPKQIGPPGVTKAHAS